MKGTAEEKNKITNRDRVYGRKWSEFVLQEDQEDFIKMGMFE